MKKTFIYTILIGIILLILYRLYFSNPETKYIDDNDLTREQTEIQASKDLYNFYIANKNKYEYYQVWSKKYRFRMEYNPCLKTLKFETSLLDGWASVYDLVDESKLKKLNESNVPFKNYKDYLNQTWGI